MKYDLHIAFRQWRLIELYTFPVRFSAKRNCNETMCNLKAYILSSSNESEEDGAKLAITFLLWGKQIFGGFLWCMYCSFVFTLLSSFGFSQSSLQGPCMDAPFYLSELWKPGEPYSRVRLNMQQLRLSFLLELGAPCAQAGAKDFF